MSDTVVLIDLSYYVFHRFFATKRWLKLSKQEFETQEMEKEMILHKFTKMFEDNLRAIKHKYKCQWKNVYLVKDCSRDTIWRMKHYPEYKKTRDESNNNFDPYVFIQTYNVIIPSMIKKYGIQFVGYETAEADDVVAVLHSLIRRKSVTRPIIIVTNDNDYLQLYDDHTIIVNCNKIELRSKIPDNVMSVFLEWKIIKGDVSDNIPPILPRIGDKKALKLALNKDMLMKKLSDDPNAKQQYMLNKLLIDFKCIPENLKNGIKNLKVI